MRKFQSKLNKKGATVTKHMQKFCIRYDPRTKILTTENGDQLQKFAHGYFPIGKFNKKAITPKVKKFLQSFPMWIVDQKEIQSQQFQSYFRIMIEAHPKQLSIFEKSEKKLSLLKEIDHIRFPFLKRLEVHFQQGTNLEPFGWLQAPNLEIILISSKSIFTSLSSLSKMNLKNLKVLKINVENKVIQELRNYDLGKTSRIRMNNLQRQGKQKIYQRGEISFFRKDVSNLSSLAKAEISRLQNFRILRKDFMNRKENIVVDKLVEALTRKYKNKASYLSTTTFLGYFKQDIYESDDSLSSDSDKGYYDYDYQYDWRQDYDDDWRLDYDDDWTQDYEDYYYQYYDD